MRSPWAFMAFRWGCGRGAAGGGRLGGGRGGGQVRELEGVVMAGEDGLGWVGWDGKLVLGVDGFRGYKR